MSTGANDDFPMQLERETDQRTGMVNDKVPPVAVAFGLFPMIDKEATTKSGFDVYKDVVHIKIAVPGDRLSIYFQPVKDNDKKRFPKAWEHYERRGSVANNGFPIEQWAVISRGLALTLKAAHIPTIEGLATLDDQHIGKFGFNARELREKARAWVKSREQGAAASVDAAEKQALKDQIASLQAQITALAGGADANAKPAKGKAAGKAPESVGIVPMQPSFTGPAAGAALLHDDIEADVAAAVRRPRSRA